MRLFPRFRKLFGLVEKPRPTNLDAAMIRIANNIRPTDSFCVKETHWRHNNVRAAREFQVSIFVGEDLPIQLERANLTEAVDAALNQYYEIVAL